MCSSDLATARGPRKGAMATTSTESLRRTPVAFGCALWVLFAPNGCSGPPDVHDFVQIDSVQQLQPNVDAWVVVRGRAWDAKANAVLRRDDFEIDLVELESWPSSTLGKTVEVRGRLARKDFSPSRPGENEPFTATPPPGTYWIVTSASWKLISH